jgi:carnitine 3-dehydrogenase
VIPYNDTGLKPDSETTIIGCGLIGVSWAALFSAYGYAVRLWDPAADWETRAERNLLTAREQLARLSVRGSGEITYSSTLREAVHESAWVQESTPESIQIKRQVFEEISACVASEAIIASSTSSFTWSQLAPFVTDPARLITAHPFNPPHLMPLVEIFSSNDVVGALAVEFYRGLGRRPIRLRLDATGHVANRLASALWREAVHIVASGIADVADVDAAVVDGPGLRWSTIGPHMAYHLGGGDGGIRSYLEHLGASQVRRWADLGTPTLSPEVCEAIASGVEREAAGRSVQQLANERDETLIATLRARRTFLER